MNTESNQKKDDVSTCPKCKEKGEFLPPPKINGRTFIATFRCPNEHTYSKELILK